MIFSEGQSDPVFVCLLVRLKMLPYQTIIQIDREDKLSIYLQISQQLTEMIVSGKLMPGVRLPGSRKMADLLRVNRNTVIAAYTELQMQGWLETDGGSGTYIKSKLPVTSEKPQKGRSVSGVLKEEAEPVVMKYHFDDGQPDIRLAPLLALTREMSALVKTDYFHRELYYPEELRGDLKLRKELASYLKVSRGISADADNILVTRGTVNSFHLYLAENINDEDLVIVGSPGYRTFTRMARDCSNHVLEVAVDEHGIDVLAIEQICKQTIPKLVYVVPHHHHPTTVTLTAERRLKLLQLAQQYQFMILEDDYDYDFQYDRNPVLPLAAHDRSDSVLYTGSFSKLLVPTVRLGFLVGPPEVINRLAERRRYVDRCGNSLIERAMANLMESGEIRRSLRKAVRCYGSRRELLCNLLADELQDYLHFKKPDGGMAIWVTFDENIDVYRLVSDCKKNGLFLTSPDDYHEGGGNQLRIGFAMMNESEIREAFIIFKACMNSQLS